eukprot:COSAG03_NODE_27646_length_252_cov_0.614379_1_plen_26_part_01
MLLCHELLHLVIDQTDLRETISSLVS